MQRKRERKLNNDRQCNIRIAWPMFKLAKNKCFWKNEYKSHINLDLGFNVERKKKLKLGFKLHIIFLFLIISFKVNKINVNICYIWVVNVLGPCYHKL